MSRPVSNPHKLASRATINRELAVLSHLLNRAVEWGWIAFSPVKVRRFQEQRTRFEYLTEAEICRPLAAAATDSHSQIYAFAYIALHTAMRAGELLSLRREFIDLDKLLIHLPRAKTGARDVPISANLKQFLQQYLQSIAGDGAWLFASSPSKSGHTEDITKPWRRIIEAAGLADRPTPPPPPPHHPPTLQSSGAFHPPPGLAATPTNTIVLPAPPTQTTPPPRPPPPNPPNGP